MAIAIKSIPVLKGAEAQEFARKADQQLANRYSIDFTKEAKIARAILKKVSKA